MTPSCQAPARAPKGAYLGISVKSVHVSGGSGDRDTKRPFLVLDEIQRVAQGLLYLDGHPVCTCQRNMLGEYVGLHWRKDGSAARYSGLITCSDVWVCATCSAQITEHRRLELQLAIRKWKAEGGDVYLMTLTAPHTRELALETFLDLFAKALQRFKNCRAYKRIMGNHGRKGSVRSLEVTWGENGWHPHTHDLIFAAPGLLDDYRALEELRHEWVRILLKVGLGETSKQSDMLEHGFDLRGGDYSAEYVAKYGRQPQLEQWGLTDELTRSHAKQGARFGHMTPFALLRAYAQGDTGAGELFREFARCFKAKRMLSWSPGLKGYFGINEASDEELARAPMPEEGGAMQLTKDEWRLVVSRNARGELKYWAAKEGEEGARAFLEELAERPRTHSGKFSSWNGRRW